MSSAKTKSVSKNTILQIYEYKQKFGDKITNAEIAKLVGISESTIYRILKGDYDHLLKDDSKQNADKDKDIPISRQLSNISEQLYELNNGLVDDSNVRFTQLASINKEIQSIGDLLHIIAVYLMRRESDKQAKSKMSQQIQAVHTNQRISDALK